MQISIMRFVIHHCAESGFTAFTTTTTATTSAASPAIRSNDLKMTKGPRLGAVEAISEIA